MKTYRKQLMMIRQIMEGKYSFASSEWNDVSSSPKDLIDKMLVVDHKQRLTVNQCLCHEFLQPRKMSRRGSILTPTDTSADTNPALLPEPEPVKFDARQSWRIALNAIQFIVRIRRLKDTPEPLCLKTAIANPYKQRMVRKVLDAAAFNVYSHSIKRAEGQNRAAMFEHCPKHGLSGDKYDHLRYYQNLRNEPS